MKRWFIIIIPSLFFILFKINELSAQNAITIARDYFDRFNDVNNGWMAADATISLLLPDGKTLWLFGDSFIGEKSGEFSIDPNNSKMINNCAIIDNDTTLITYYGGTPENPSSLIPGIDGDIFWPEHATIENDTLKIFAIKIIFMDGDDPFSFRTEKTHIAQFTYPEMEHIDTKPVEFITDTTMRFGTHILKRDNYTYIFGKKDTTSGDYTYPIPMLARVTNSVSEPWEFYAGADNWSYNCEEAKPIGDRPMSESFYVFEQNNMFYIIMHEIWTVGELYILEADQITGPYNRSTSGGTENLFGIIPPHGNNFTYNLFAHPQFQNNNKILISFNVNTYNFSSIYNDTKNYRARFLWLSIGDATSITIPDTVHIFDDFTDMVNSVNNPKINGQHINYCAGNIYIKNINKPSVLNVFSVDGKNHVSLELSEDKTVSIVDLPKSILIIQLINKDGIITKKIFNNY